MTTRREMLVGAAAGSIAASGSAFAGTPGSGGLTSDVTRGRHRAATGGYIVLDTATFAPAHVLVDLLATRPLANVAVHVVAATGQRGKLAYRYLDSNGKVSDVRELTLEAGAGVLLSCLWLQSHEFSGQFTLLIPAQT